MKLWKYWDVNIDNVNGEVVKARFKKNRLTRTTYIFRSNQPWRNIWNEPGYGWGFWEKVK